MADRAMPKSRGDDTIDRNENGARPRFRPDGSRTGQHDYSFFSHDDRVNLPQLLDLVPRWVPDEAVRRRILVDNPRQLLGF
jgi:hypothetical protein